MRLHRCARCRRHIRLDESRCPFCSCETVARSTVTALTIGGALSGCIDRAVQESGTDDTGTTTSSSTTSTPTTTTTSGPTSTLSTDPSVTLDSSATIDSGDDVTGDESSSDDGWDTCVGFYGGCPPDGGMVTYECDLWAQDCPEDEKCMPWANDGDDDWNATRCSPVDASPGQPNDPCTAEGSGVSGIDDCDIGTMCWGVDPDTNQGTCVAFCTGSEANPLCEDPATECLIANDGVLILCLPPCDPLLNGCGEGEGCYPGDNGGFFCLPDASGDGGGHGDPCEYPNGCDPGLLCVPPERVFGCADPFGCCTEVCDLQTEDPNAACSGLADGEVCTAYYDEGQAPPELADLGVCILPEA